MIKCQNFITNSQLKRDKNSNTYHFIDYHTCLLKDIKNPCMCQGNIYNCDFYHTTEETTLAEAESKFNVKIVEV